MQDMSDNEVEKVTRRYKGLTSAQTVTRLREKYSERYNAVKKFTERLEKSGGFVDDAEIATLRAVGLSEEEIEALVDQYGA